MGDTKLKYCQNCKYCELNISNKFGDLSKCNRIINTKSLTVKDGIKKLHRWEFCSIQRQDGFLMSRFLGNTCGIEGRFFEAKK